MMTHPHRSIRGGPPKEDVGGPYHGKITKNTSYKDVGLIRQSNIACYHACAKCIFLFCIFSCKQCKVEQLSQSIDNQKHQNCDHPWDPSKWAREGGLRAEVRHDLFVGVTPEMEGPGFDSRNGDNYDDYDEDNNIQGGAETDTNKEDNDK